MVTQVFVARDCRGPNPFPQTLKHHIIPIALHHLIGVVVLKLPRQHTLRYTHSRNWKHAYGLSPGADPGSLSVTEAFDLLVQRRAEQCLGSLRTSHEIAQVLSPFFPTIG